MMRPTGALHAVLRARRRFRVRLWALRARGLARLRGCDLEIVLGSGVTFHTPPNFEVSRHPPDPVPLPRRGRLRLEIGAGSHLGRDMTIEFVPWLDGTVVLGEALDCGTAVRLIVLGGQIRTGPDTRLYDGVLLKSSGRLTLGEAVIVSSYAALHAQTTVTVEDRVSIAERVTVIDSDHQPDGSDTWVQHRDVVAEPVVLERNVFVGANSVVRRGVRLGRNSAVAAGSVVAPGTYQAGWLIAGTPAAPKAPLGPDAP